MPKALAILEIIMPNPKYSCVVPGCSQTRINKHYVNHLLDGHTPAELRERLRSQIQRGSLGMLLRTAVKVDGQEHLVYICLACKKVLGRTALSVEHRENCPNKEEHKRIAKQLLVEDPTEVTKKEISIQTDSIKAEPVKVQKALPDIRLFDMTDYLIDILLDLEKDPGHYFLDKLVDLQDNYSNIFEYVLVKGWGEDSVEAMKNLIDDHRNR
jgi:hypothetical protein